MGKIKSHIEDFLADGGSDLGYDFDQLPELKDFEIVLKHNVPVWEYKGYETERAYYGG